MNHLARIIDLLPPVYSHETDSVLMQFLNSVALEMEALQEDLDRMRRTHWLRFAYRIEDLEKIADLVNIEKLPWEALPIFRERITARVTALLKGALNPAAIKAFVYDYLTGAERVLDSVFVPGLQDFSAEEAFRKQADRPLFRPIEFVENPLRQRQSATLRAIGGMIPYLYRWEEVNRGLEDTVATFQISGLAGRRTTVPILVNLSTGDLIGYAGTLALGQTLLMQSMEGSEQSRDLTATIDGHDVTSSAFSVSDFTPGKPFDPPDMDASPRLPRMIRGVNHWVFLSVGLFDVKGLDHFFFAIADDRLREGVFNQTFFDQSLFPSGPVASVQMRWTELEPAAFGIRIPRHMVIEPALAEISTTDSAHQQVGEVLQLSIQDLRAAGVRAEVRFEPFRGTQRQPFRVQLPWVRLDPERGSAGARDRISLGGRFGETRLDDSRFE